MATGRRSYSHEGKRLRIFKLSHYPRSPSSLFQSKDEPEGHEGQAKWGRSFRVLDLSQVSSRSLCGGMWESVVSISKVGGKAVGSFIPADFSTDRHFFRPFRQPMR